MKFAFGFLAGIVVGFAAAVAYSVQTDRDLREEYAGARSDISQRDFDALGARLETRFSEMQSLIEARVNQMRGTDGTGEAIEEVVEEKLEAAEEAAEQAAEEASS
jgi:gas vesicle protein